MTELVLSAALPALASALENALGLEGRLDVAQQIAALVILDRCRCDDDSCATFYTAPKPEGAYGPGHASLELEGIEGMVVLDLVGDRICCIEILGRADLRHILAVVLP